MTKQKIIITGVSGFIGSALAKWLNEDEHHKYEVIGIDREEWIDKGNDKFYHQDINEPLPDIGDVYAVIHLAARPGVRNSHELFNEVCKDNILGTQRIISKCIDSWQPKKLLIASSSSVYGDNGVDEHALHEDEVVSPKSPYAMSKVANEQMLLTYTNCGLLDGIDAIALRFFTVYGPNQRNELAIRAFTDWILKDEPITLYGTGEQVRDFTHIDDICSGIEELLNAEYYKEIVYNIGSGRSISINKIIHMICDITGKDVTINYQPRNIYDVDATKACIEKIFNNTNWGPKVEFEDGLREQIEWQKKQLKSK